MNHFDHNTDDKKNKHLSQKERTIIEYLLKEGYSGYQIARKLNQPKSTIYHEIGRGTTTQIIQGKKREVYRADYAQKVYETNGQRFVRLFKFLDCCSLFSNS